MLIGSWWLLGRVMDVTGILLVVTDAQLVAVGTIADTVNRRMGAGR